jgi:hypothetical protein
MIRISFVLWVLLVALFLTGCFGKSKHDMCIEIVEAKARKVSSFLGDIKIPKSTENYAKSNLYESCMAQPMEQVKSQYQAISKNPYK